MNNAEIIFLNEALTWPRYTATMDLSVSLQAVLLRRTAETAERVAQARLARQREEAEQAPAKFGEAISQKEKDKHTQPIEPAAITDSGLHLDVVN